jgi:hypothetical protein
VHVNFMNFQSQFDSYWFNKVFLEAWSLMRVKESWLCGNLQCFVLLLCSR